jgi:hypothetical protein
VSAKVQTVHVRVSDAAKGQPTPVRIRFEGPGGEYFAPFGRLTDFATGMGEDVGGNLLLGEKKYAYIDGTCEVRLPPGDLTVEVHKGPEYLPWRRVVHLNPGQIALRFVVERWADVRADGWYGGDVGALHLTPHGALLEGRAEDLAVVNLLVSQYATVADDDTQQPVITNVLAFSGQRPALAEAGCTVVVNTLNTHPLLGNLALLNCHRVVYPLSFGQGPAGLDDWSLTSWCDQCHRKGGLVAWMDAADIPGEALADAILGKVDALAVNGSDVVPDVVALWYQLLDSGIRIPLVGASSKADNRQPLGKPRTYARLPDGEEFSYPAWIKAVRAGRTFATSGPLLLLTINGEQPGAVIELPARGGSVRVRARAQGTSPFGRLEIVSSGRVVVAEAASGSPSAALVETDLPVHESGWLAARCGGEVTPDAGDPPPFAHTSAVYVRVGGQPMRADAEAVRSLTELMDETLAWVRTRANCPDPRQRDQLEATFIAARQELASRVA